LRAKDSIIALPKGSEYTTTTTSKAPEAATKADKAKDNKELKAFNAYLIDNYNSLNFKRILKY
jgi:hypothetical protein